MRFTTRFTLVTILTGLALAALCGGAAAATLPIVAVDMDPSTPLVIDPVLMLAGPVGFVDIGVVVDLRNSVGFGDVKKIVIGAINAFNTGGATVSSITPLSITDLIPPAASPNNAHLDPLAGEFQFGLAIVERGVAPNNFFGGPAAYARMRVTLSAAPLGSSVRIFAGDRGSGSGAVLDGAGSEISGDATPDGTPVTGVAGFDESATAKIDYRDGVVFFGGACNASAAPQCGGACPAGQECVSDLPGQACRCVPGPTPCGSAQSPECDGECPPAQICNPSATGSACVCGTAQPCTSAQAPQCGGLCPQGQQCALGTGANVCVCEPTIVPCAQSQSPACGGECTIGFECKPGTTGGCSCLPVAQACTSSAAPQCGGSCPQGEQCRIDPTGSNCQCAPLDPQCSRSVAPTCGGFCPDGQICAQPAAGGPCTCQTLACSGSPFPECGGSCAAGSTCRPGAVTGACACEPDNLPCGQAAAPQCGGVCPAGQMCELAPGSTSSCACEPIQNPPCSTSQAPQCGGSCAVATDLCMPDASGACVCQPPIPTCGSQLYPQCGGTCPQGSACRQTLTGAGCECADLGMECEDTTAPLCGGFCANGFQCQPAGTSGACACAPCGHAPPVGATVMDWDNPTHIVFRPVACAQVYNLYRLAGPGFKDADGDGVADDYGLCLAASLTTTMYTDTAPPPAGQMHAYLVSAENQQGETSLGMTSSGASRPVSHPCP